MRQIAWRTILPALLAILLFSGVVFLYLLPSLGRVVIDQKRLMIRELTETSWNVLARFEAEERAGLMTREAAQEAAVAQVRSLHYGQQSKDYFWIIDMVPRMVVHPYRPDLEGSDLTDLADPEGKLLFVEMVQVVQQDGAGYVDYMWQWKDDPQRIVPKLSYVKGFTPWGWILGTGVYTEDVGAEIAALKCNLQRASWIILGLVSLLMFLLLRAGFLAESGRLRVKAALQNSEEKYRSLVESAGEAIIMAIEGEGLYANTSLLHLLGYERQEFSLLDAGEVILPTTEEIENDRRHWQAVTHGIETPSRYEAELLCRDGQLMRVMLTVSRIVVQGQTGFMAVAARLSRPRELDILTAENLDDLEAASKRTADLAALMMRHGANGVQVSGMLSHGADAVVRKAIEFIVAELGPPPCPFDIMLMGSLGRSEVTLSADQDHALIYPDVAPGQADAVQDYFLRMGSRLADLLDAAGYPYCKGKIMASEAACCLPASAWQSTFAQWISTLEADDLLHAKIFFDFRSALNEGSLVPSLQEHLQLLLARQPRFFPLLAHSILQYQPPISSFGKLVLKDIGGARNGFDIKGVIAQVADIARLRALQFGVTEVGTIGRLEALQKSRLLNPQTASDLGESFLVLLDIRLDHQARRRANQLAADNMIDPKELEPDKLKNLKTALGRIRDLQENIRHEFGVHHDR